MPNNPTTPAQGGETCPDCNHAWSAHAFNGIDSKCIGNRNLCGCRLVPFCAAEGCHYPVKAGSTFCHGHFESVSGSVPTPHQEPDTNTISHPFQAGSGNKCDLCGRSQALHPLQPEPEEWGKHIDKGVTHFKGDDCDPVNVERPSTSEHAPNCTGRHNTLGWCIVPDQPSASDHWRETALAIKAHPGYINQYQGEAISTEQPSATDPMSKFDEAVNELLTGTYEGLPYPTVKMRDEYRMAMVSAIRQAAQTMKDEAVREAIRRTGEALKARYPRDQRDPYGIREAVNADMDEVVANTLAALPTIDARKEE